MYCILQLSHYIYVYRLNQLTTPLNVSFMMRLFSLEFCHLVLIFCCACPSFPLEQYKTHHVFQQVVRINLHHLQKWALSHSAGSFASTLSGLSILTWSVRWRIRSAFFALLPHLQIDCLSHHCDILPCVDGDGISLFTFWQHQFSVLMRWCEK